MSSQSKKIAIIDDDPTFIAVLQRKLAELGYELDNIDVERIAEGEIVHYARGVSLFLVDIGLPILQGDRVAQTFLTRRVEIQNPVFLVSALPEAELAQRAKETEADGYMAKEWGFDELVGRIHRFLTGRSQTTASGDKAQ